MGKMSAENFDPENQGGRKILVFSSPVCQISSNKKSMSIIRHIFKSVYIHQPL